MWTRPPLRLRTCPTAVPADRPSDPSIGCHAGQSSRHCQQDQTMPVTASLRINASQAGNATPSAHISMGVAGDRSPIGEFHPLPRIRLACAGREWFGRLTGPGASRRPGGSGTGIVEQAVVCCLSYARLQTRRRRLAGLPHRGEGFGRFIDGASGGDFAPWV